VAVLHVLDEVLGRLRRLVGVEFEHDLAVAGVERDRRAGGPGAEAEAGEREQGKSGFLHAVSGYGRTGGA